MAGENESVSVTNVQGSHQEQVTITQEEVTNNEANKDVVTHETLGVTEQQFEKYYKDGNYNWEAHAKEVEFAQQQKEKPAEATEGDESTENVDPDDQAAKDTVEGLGLDWDDLSQQIVDNGDISTEAKEALVKAGIPQDIVDDYIDSLHNRAGDQVKAVVESFGGQEEFAKVQQFVVDNYSETEIEALEKSLSDPSSSSLTIDMIKAKMGAGAPSTPTEVTTPSQNTGGGGNQVKPFANQMEMVNAQRDPRYRTDPNYRNEVIARAAASTWQTNVRTHSGGM